MLTSFHFNIDIGLFYCDKCDRVFTSQGVLNTHKKRHRPDISEKRHRCTLCPYATHYSSHLRQHSFTHSGERPFKCGTCDAGFTQKSLLRKHLLNHEKRDGSTNVDKVANNKSVSNKEHQVKQSSTVKEVAAKGNILDHGQKEDVTKQDLVNLKKTCIGGKKQKASSKEVSAKGNKLDNGLKEDVKGKDSENIEIIRIGDKKQQRSQPTSEDDYSVNKIDQEQKKDVAKADSKKFEKERISDNKQQPTITFPKHHVLDYKPTEDSPRTEDSTRRTEDSTTIDKTFVNDVKQQTSEYSKETSSKNCERCGAEFSDDKQLQKHLRMQRKKDKPHKCKMCNKRFITLSSLSRHQKKYHGKTKSSSSTKELKVNTKNEPSKLASSGIEMSPISDKDMSVQGDGELADDKTTSSELKPLKMHQTKPSISPGSKNIKSSSTRNKLNRNKMKSYPLSDSNNETSTSNNQTEISSDVKKTSGVVKEEVAVSRSTRTIPIDEDKEKHETTENLTEEPENSHVEEIFVSQDRKTIQKRGESTSTYKTSDKSNSHEEDVADKSMPII